jgi:hypothetical protein
MDEGIVPVLFYNVKPRFQARIKAPPFRAVLIGNSV